MKRMRKAKSGRRSSAEPRMSGGPLSFPPLIERAFETLEPRVHLNAAAPAVSAPLNLSHSVVMLSQYRLTVGTTGVGTKALFSGGIDGNEHLIGSVDILDTVSGQLTTHAVAPFADLRHAMSVGSKALFISNGGASAAVSIYDDSTGLWSQGSLSGARGGVATAVAGTKVVFACGFEVVPSRGVFNSRAVDVYNSLTGKWTTARLSQARDTTGVTVGSKVIFAGGDGSGVLSRAVDMYDAKSGRWSTARLSQARDVGAAVVVGDLAMFAGGTTGKAINDSGPTASVDIYNAATGRWTTSRLPQASAYLAAAAVGTDAIFVSADGSVDIFDSVAGSWSVATVTQGDNQLKGVQLGTKAIFAGGNAPFVSVLDVSNAQWSTVPTSAIFDGGELGMTTLGAAAYVAGGTSINVYTDLTPTPVLSGGLTGSIRQRDRVTVINTGDADLPAGYTIQLYASPDRTLSGATLVGSLAVPAPLAAGASAPFKVRTVIPAGTPAGTYHLLAAVQDAAGHITPIAAEDATFRLRGATAALARPSVFSDRQIGSGAADATAGARVRAQLVGR